MSDSNVKSSHQKRFDFEPLKEKLSERDDVMLAFVFGSAKDGDQVRPDSDVDIAVWLRDGPPGFDDLVYLIGICQDALHYENIDLSILNTASNLLRFEALSGRRLVVKDLEFYADFFSKTCRYHEDEVMRSRRNRRIWEEAQRDLEKRK